ncbi:activator-dependent family glycosyltransferase [Spirillospora sp. NPDC050679]
MKVLFTCWTHITHWYPLLPMAWALRTAGHEVRVATRPGLVADITRTGLATVAVGHSEELPIDDPVDRVLLKKIDDEAFAHLRDFDWTGRDRSQWTWERLLGLSTVVVPAHDAVLTNDAMLDDLAALARDWRPDLVIWETYSPAGAITARVCGAAHARMIAGPDITTRVRQAFLDAAAEQPAEHRDDPTAEWLDWTLDRLGCAEGFGEDMVTGQWTIDATAPSTRLDLGLPTVSVRYVPHDGPAVVPDWLREPERPRVCLTFGVSEWIAEFLPGSLIARTLDAMADLDVEIVATLNQRMRADLGALPDNVRVVDFVPLNDLLPTCSALVHHGGWCTKCNAELHGVPQIILPFGVDTTVMGDDVQALGAGLSLPVTELSAEGLRDGVERLLSEPSFAERAGALRAEILAEPSPNEIVPRIEELTAAHRTRAAH